MAIAAILILLFFLLLVVFAFTGRKSTLEQLSLLEGEEVLFDEEGISVEQKGSPSVTVYPDCLVRVTNRRIIVAQKVLWRKNIHMLKYIFQYGNEGENARIGGSLKRGYLVSTIHPSRVTLLGETVRVAIPESILLRHQYLQFFTSRANEYWTLFH